MKPGSDFAYSGWLPRRNAAWSTLAVVCLGMTLLGGCSHSVTLITAEEYAPVADIELEEMERGTLPPNAPKIIVMQPDVGLPIQAPIDIDVRFESATDAKIDAQSARIVYAKGFLRKDITDKLTKYGRLDANGIFCANAKIPPGKHRILVEVGDTRGRVGMTEMRFTVSKD